MAKRTKKPVDISTAQVADGAARSYTSVYEICGVSTHKYTSSSADDYKKSLSAMNLIELQDEAYKHAIVPTSSRELLIDRLERKFIEEVGKFKHETTAQETTDNALRNQALKILSRGR